MSVGVESVFNEEQIVSGGVTGLGIIIEALSFGKVPVWITNLACNIPLFIAGVKVLDRTSMKQYCLYDNFINNFHGNIACIPNTYK